MLFGLNELRCPECGFEITNDDDLAAARWLADTNFPYRRAASKKRLKALFAIALLCSGAFVGLLGVTVAVVYFLVGGPIIITTLVLIFSGADFGHNPRYVFYLGLVWLFTCLVLWLMLI